MPRYPAPARAEARPAAVVRWRKAPWCAVDPGQAPGRDIDPTPFPVRRPVGIDVARVPDRPVAGVVLPIAVGIELLVTDHLARHIAGRHRLIFDAVARVHPARKVAARHLAGADGGQVAPRHRQLLAAAERARRASVAVDHSTARQYRDLRQVGRRVGVDLVLARALDHQRQVAGVELDALAGHVLAHPHLQAAPLQRDAQHLVVQFGKRQQALLVESQRGRADVQFSPRVAVGPQPVAAAQGAIRDGAVPPGVSRRRKDDRALLGAQARHTAGRVALRRLGRSREPEPKQHQPECPVAPRWLARAWASLVTEARAEAGHRRLGRHGAVPRRWFLVNMEPVTREPGFWLASTVPSVPLPWA